MEQKKNTIGMCACLFWDIDENDYILRYIGGGFLFWARTGEQKKTWRNGDAMS